MSQTDEHILRYTHTQNKKIMCLSIPVCLCFMCLKTFIQIVDDRSVRHGMLLLELLNSILL